ALQHPGGELCRGHCLSDPVENDLAPSADPASLTSGPASGPRRRTGRSTIGVVVAAVGPVPRCGVPAATPPAVAAPPPGRGGPPGRAARRASGRTRIADGITGPATGGVPPGRPAAGHRPARRRTITRPARRRTITRPARRGAITRPARRGAITRP